MTLKSTEWNQYSEAAFTDKYPTYQLGWFPDYPDPDDYVGNFLSEDQLPEHPLRQPRGATSCWPRRRRRPTTPCARRRSSGSRRSRREDAPNIPIWQGDQVGAVRDGVEGVEDTFDPAFIFRFWLITKS